jgi:hypothetical protein
MANAATAQYAPDCSTGSAINGYNADAQVLTQIECPPPATSDFLPLTGVDVVAMLILGAAFALFGGLLRKATS